MSDSVARAEGLAGRVIRSGLWMAGLKITAYVVGLVRLVVLARLLTPRDFGLVGMALVVSSMFEAFSATGTQGLLIHRQAAPRELFDTAWTVSCLRGVFVASLMVTSAPLVAGFFGSPEGVAVVRVMALVPLIAGLANVGVVEFRRELAFRPLYVLHASAVVTDLCVAVPLALWLGNVWALVAGAVAMMLVRTIVSYVVHPYRPRPRLDRDRGRELLGFGRWVFGSSVVGWLLSNGVHAVVGRLLGVQAMAFYRMGWRVAYLPTSEVTAVVSGVTVGAYAKLQESPERLRKAYLRVLTLVAVLAIPMAVAIVVYGADLVRVLLGRRWEPVVPILRVLALLGLARSVGTTVGPLLQGLGRPRLDTFVALGELGVVAGLLVPLTLWLGPVGPAVAATVGAALAATTSLWVVTRLLRIGLRRLVPILGWPLLAGLPAVALPVGLVGSHGTLVGLASTVAVSAALYLGSLALLDRLRVHTLDPALLAGVRRWVAAAPAGPW